MKKIIQLSEICVTFDEARELNNVKESALAWVLNRWKHCQEWEVMPVEEVMKQMQDNRDKPVSDFIKEDWELYPVEVLVAMDQIKFLIEKGDFFYAPLKK